jgi:hypothetical protein
MESNANVVSRRTTRRTVVKSGAKLAYTAPLIAASLRLTAGTASAASQACEPGVCDAPGPCGDPDFCGCVMTNAGTGFCVADVACAGLLECQTSNDCAPTEGCVTNTCCGVQVCAPGCGTVPVGLALADSVESLPTVLRSQ